MMPKAYQFFKQRERAEEMIEKYGRCVTIKVHMCMCVQEFFWGSWTDVTERGKGMC